MVVNEKQIDLIISCIERSNDTYDVISSRSGVSKSTISRLVKLRQATKYTLDRLASYFEVGEQMASLGGNDDQAACPLVAGVSDELKRLEGIFAEREARLQTQCDERVSFVSKQLDMMTAHHNQVVERMQHNINFLKEENALLRAENKELINKHEQIHADSASSVKKAEEQSNAILRKKHFVYRSAIIVSIFLAICVATLSILLYFALKSDAII